MKVFSRMQLSIVFLVAAALAGIAGLATPSLFESLKDLSVSDIYSRTPVAISKRILVSGKCYVQLYGWAIENTGPTDGADEYLKIVELDALLTSQGHSVSLATKPKVNDAVPEHIWEIDVPRSGNLEIKIQSYVAPSKDLKIAYAFLSCENSGIRWVPGVLFLISALLGLVGISLLLIYGTRTAFRK